MSEQTELGRVLAPLERDKLSYIIEEDIDKHKQLY